MDALRNGDDSLAVLYQALNPTHIHLLPQNFHTIFPLNILSEKYINSLTFVHQVGKFHYWDNYNYKNNVRRYFYNKSLEFIYNNFNLQFIKKYIPSIYIDISKTVIPFYYYNKNSNFGDHILPYFFA